mgnify:FL=1
MFILVACSNNSEDNATNSDKIEKVNASAQLSEDTTLQINKLELQNEELQSALNSMETDLK